MAGNRVVAVGERGFAMLSDDAGKTWKPRETPVTRTLTGVAFKDAKVGVAVGHGGSLVTTGDGGENWVQVPMEEAGSDSLLGVVHLGDDRFAAYGAFGLYFDTTDAGKTWTRRVVIDEEFDRHISQVLPVGQSLLMVAESGMLARSDDGGATWTALESPYVGSYFGAIALQDGAILVFGMRSNVFRSVDMGATWQKIDLKTDRVAERGTAARRRARPARRQQRVAGFEQRRRPDARTALVAGRSRFRRGRRRPGLRDPGGRSRHHETRPTLARAALTPASAK